MLESVYPNYRNEYEEVKHLSELTDDEFELFVDYEFSNWGTNNDFYLADKFNVKPEIMYSNIEHYGENKYWYGRLSDEGMEIIKSSMNQDSYFLFSIDENPNWEKQELLMNIGKRYHLG